MISPKSKSWFTFILIAISINCTATDSTRYVLTKEAFVNIVNKYHPVARQAGLQVNRSKANLLQSRGAFDPELSTKIDRKSFAGDLYYSYFKPELVIPTWYGVELKAGLEEVLGDKAQPEMTLGQTSYLGFKIPANQLFFDKRRAALRQAQTIVQQTEAERILAVNNLLYDALAAYWNWTEKYLSYKIISNAVAVSAQRARFVKIEFEQGQRPAIDTVEALTQLQTFYFQENLMLLAYQNAGLELSSFLWLDNDVPVSWSDMILPDTTEFEKTATVIPDLAPIISAGYDHPKLRSIRYKIDVLEIEKKLKAQYLMPKFDLSANLLSKGYKLPQEINVPVFENNHKVGFSFNMPLFLRDARGAYSAAKFKIQETNLELANMKLQIENKIKSYYNELRAVQQQLGIMNSANTNFIKLYQGEKLRFENGESSLFLLNARQSKVLESSQKLVELKTKWQKAYAALLWSSGTLY